VTWVEDRRVAHRLTLPDRVPDAKSRTALAT
jgi:hypothetical protein